MTNIQIELVLFSLKSNGNRRLAGGTGQIAHPVRKISVTNGVMKLSDQDSGAFPEYFFSCVPVCVL